MSSPKPLYQRSTSLYQILLLFLLASFLTPNFALGSYDPWPTGAPGSPNSAVISVQGIGGGATLSTTTSNGALEAGGNLAALAAAQGASATGVTQPSGGSGILGWLSGIYSRVNGTLTTSITGTPSVSQAGSWTTGRTWSLSSGADSITATISGVPTIGGTVVANAGANLNTSALALETGGNLAAVAAAQGVAGAGLSPPTGGSGILGYLSGIYSRTQTGAAGAPTQTAVLVGTTSTTVLAAATATNFIKLCVSSTAANGVWVRWDGNAAAQSTPSEYLVPGQCDSWVKSTGFLPTSQINAIAASSTSTSLIYQ